MNRVLLHAFALCLFSAGHFACQEVHVWEVQEIKLTAEKPYDNPYTDVSVWVDLKGPVFEKRIYGFWNGDSDFRIRV